MIFYSGVEQGGEKGNNQWGTGEGVDAIQQGPIGGTGRQDLQQEANDQPNRGEPFRTGGGIEPGCRPGGV